MIIITIPHQKLSSPHLNSDKNDSTQPQKAFKYDKKKKKNTAVVLASSTFSESTREKENSIMLAKIGDLKPITLMSRSGKDYYFLASSDNIDEVLGDQPSGL